MKKLKQLAKDVLKEWKEQDPGPKRWFKSYGDKYTEYEKSTNKSLQEGTKSYELGDMWSNDFDYVGMLKAGSEATYEMGLEYLQKLYDSFEDVNYHSENSHLGRAIESIPLPLTWIAEAVIAPSELTLKFDEEITYCPLGSNLKWIKDNYKSIKYSNFVTKSNSGERAVTEACLHIIKKFFYKKK